MRSIAIISILTLFMVVMDLYTYRGIQFLLPQGTGGNRAFTLVFWGLTAAIFFTLLWAGLQFQKMRDPSKFFGIMLVMGLFLMLYIPKLMFNLTQIIGDLTSGVINLVSGKAGGLVFKKYLLLAGGFLGLILFLGFGYGMTFGRTHVKVFRESIPISELPASFEGLKIVQLSDIHLAGFYKHQDHIRKVVRRVNQLKPDLILFTGDMVHNFSEEMDPFIGILDSLEAPLGKFAILGNHDYGSYYQWESTSAEASNLERVKSQIRAAGFDLLLNEYRTVSLNGSSLQIIGIENWGKPPFPQMGDLPGAMQGSDPDLINVLMSHDPSHWDLQVRGQEEIQLTLSGHTHGMQFGIEIGNFRWSPSKWTYKHWGGLYQENGQYLYVNRGLGFTGFPGRVGIRPEISLLTLSGT